MYAGQVVKFECLKVKFECLKVSFDWLSVPLLARWCLIRVRV